VIDAGRDPVDGNQNFAIDTRHERRGASCDAYVASSGNTAVLFHPNETYLAVCSDAFLEDHRRWRAVINNVYSRDGMRLREKGRKGGVDGLLAFAVNWNDYIDIRVRHRAVAEFVVEHASIGSERMSNNPPG
jgi:hypothetical protein